MKLIALAAVSASLAVAGVAAANTNLLTNGSFETGSFSGWTINNAAPVFPGAVYLAPSVTAGENGGGWDPDPAGSYLADYVANPSNESITQHVYLTPGVYNMGFEAYLFSYQNPDDETFTASLAGNANVASISSASSAAGAWDQVSGFITITTAGWYDPTFTYSVTGRVGRDMYVDRLYLVETDRFGVPEPASWALMIVGFGLVGAGMRGGAERRLRARA